MNEEITVNEEELLGAVRDQVGVQAAVPPGAEWEVSTRGNRVVFLLRDSSASPPRGLAVEAERSAVARAQEALVVDVIAQQFVSALRAGLPGRGAGAEFLSFSVQIE